MVGYKPEEVPEKTLAKKNKECRGGKKAKEHLTVFFYQCSWREVATDCDWKIRKPKVI